MLLIAVPMTQAVATITQPPWIKKAQTLVWDLSLLSIVILSFKLGSPLIKLSNEMSKKSLRVIKRSISG